LSNRSGMGLIKYLRARPIAIPTMEFRFHDFRRYMRFQALKVGHKIKHNY
jgi:hypothetical protein